MKQTKQKSRFAVRLPDPLREILEEAARRRFTSESEIVRVALLEKFEREGICPPPMRAA
jgi:Arc/MetJ-type ribon-helix-helix transcriptional regulator